MPRPSELQRPTPSHCFRPASPIMPGHRSGPSPAPLSSQPGAGRCIPGLLISLLTGSNRRAYVTADGRAAGVPGAEGGPNSKHWFTTAFLQPLPYLVTSQVPENCQLTSSFSLVLKQ